MVDRPLPDVWDFLYAPENAPLYDHSVLEGYRAPGSPLGVGEIQMFRLREQESDGAEDRLLTITEFEPPRRVVYEVPVPGGKILRSLRTEIRLREVGRTSTEITDLSSFSTVHYHPPAARAQLRRRLQDSETTRQRDDFGAVLLRALAAHIPPAPPATPSLTGVAPDTEDIISSFRQPRGDRRDSENRRRIRWSHIAP